MTKLKNKPQRFSAALSEDTLTMSIYDSVGETWDGKGATAEDFQAALQANPIAKTVAVRINSPGGDATVGLAIYNLLKASGKQVSIYVDGLAASAASIIAMAGDTVTMGTGAMLMIHEAWSFAAGNSTEMRQCADILDKISDSLADVYVAKSCQPKAGVLAAMKAETWMSADEALENGFADAKVDGDDDAQNRAKKFALLASFRNLPEDLKPKAEIPLAEAEKPPVPSNISLYDARLRALQTISTT